VATQDTVTLVRSAIRGLLRACPPHLAAQVRQGLQRSDDDRAPGKPACDWDDPAARERLVDALTRDGYRALVALRGQPLDARAREAAELLAVVVGQDIEETDDGRFRIAQGTAPDRIISTVDPQARHGHKTTARGFDGDKAHIAIDPDSELITAAETSTATTSDAELTDRLLEDLTGGQHGQRPERPGQPAQAVAYGDASYGSGANLARLEHLGVQARVKAPMPTAPGGRWAKTAFRIDLAAGTVTCPAKVTVPIIATRHGGRARFGRACSVCPFRDGCTASPTGRTISIHPYEAELLAARARQRTSTWLADYRATRPKVERKLAHLLRRRHGGRRVRMRGLVRIGQDFKLLAAAVNLARLAVLGLDWYAGRWQVAVA
jgi:Transposase DDE domain